MRVRLLLVAAVFTFAIVLAPSSASAACPEQPLNALCDPGGGGGGEDPGTLAVGVTTSPIATVGSPMWDDENLTYTVQVSNMNGFPPVCS